LLRRCCRRLSSPQGFGPAGKFGSGGDVFLFADPEKQLRPGVAAVKAYASAARRFSNPLTVCAAFSRPRDRQLFIPVCRGAASSAAFIPAIAHSPATGYRRYDTGVLNVVGTEGGCWSSSPLVADDLNAGDFWFRSNNVNPLNNGYRSYAIPVRCVQYLRLLFQGRLRSRFCLQGAGQNN